MSVMGRKIKLFLAFSVLLLTTMCRLYDQGGRVTSTNGLSCQNYTDYASFEDAAECSYICPDGTIKQPVISERFSTSSSLYSASKEELDARFCPRAFQPTPTELPTSISPTVPAPASPTAQISPTSPPPLLTGEVTSCDRSKNLINFRMIESDPDLEGKTLKVLIAEHESTCAVNPLNPSLLTCTTAIPLTFPMRVVVRLDGAAVNDFISDGFGCLANH
jgi:hypothetical protein